MNTNRAGSNPDSVADSNSVPREADNGPTVHLEAATLDVLGSRLRQNYQQIIDEGVPSKFLDLLNRKTER